MDQIKPLDQLDDAEISVLAASAAERGEPVEDANPFPPGSRKHEIFMRAYRAREDELHPTPQ
ncbi:MAG: hypothetical protein KF686_03530 [Ramlibacter sp.]|nr:hypothetical protein [Ramlibacter sp.]